MVENLTINKEFEHLPYREVERKFLPLFPEQLEELRSRSQPVEQFYISHPNEPFMLRLREVLTENGALQYTATLKNRGDVTSNGLERLEIETDISPELYLQYKTDDTPVLRKLRTTIGRYVAVDFFEDGRVLVESENPIALTHFTDQYAAMLVDVTGDHQADNEWMAHLRYRQNNQGVEALVPEKDSSPNEIVEEIVREYTKTPAVIVQIGGRSGSGKSTLVKAVAEQLQQYGLGVTILSTDDYHRGADWLRQYNNGQEWTAWDDEIVYDIDSVVRDVEKLRSGQSVPKRMIDFTTVEPVVVGEVAPAAVTIIEGIYALSPRITQCSSLRYELPTPLATCAGRRILRDMQERPQFTPSENLRYVLEQAEPAYRNQRQIRP